MFDRMTDRVFWLNIFADIDRESATDKHLFGQTVNMKHLNISVQLLISKIGGDIIVHICEK